MSLVAAADYLVRFRYPETLPVDWKDKFSTFMKQPSITVTKKTKKGEKEMDIRPLVYSWHFEEDGIFLQVSSGSSDNLRPELVVEAFAKANDLLLNEFSLLIHRKEVYADLGSDKEHDFCALDALGKTNEKKISDYKNALERNKNYRCRIGRRWTHRGTSCLGRSGSGDSGKYLSWTGGEGAVFYELRLCPY